MGTTLAQLVSIRSRTAEALEQYYRSLLERLDRTPWYRDDAFVCASDIAIPAQVLKEDTRLPDADRKHEASEETRDEREPGHARLDPEIARLYEEPTREKRRLQVTWDAERASLSRAVVLGPPGGGKTFLTVTTTLDLAAEGLRLLHEGRTPLDRLPLPVHLALPDLVQSGPPSAPLDGLIDLLNQQNHNRLAGLEPWLRQQLPTERCWLVLDALDEVPKADRRRLMQWLEALAPIGEWRSRIVLTCRSADYEREGIPWTQLTEYELAGLGPFELRRFVEGWFRADVVRSEALRRVLDLNYALAHACRSPLVATFTCLAHEQVTKDTRRGELYELVLRGLLQRAWKDDRLTEQDLHIDDMVQLLEEVAVSLFERRPESNHFSVREVTSAINSASTFGAHKDPVVLRMELLSAGILVGTEKVQRGDRQVSFLHRSVLEYLVARALGEQGWQAVRDRVHRRAWLPAWQEVIVLLAGRLHDPAPLLDLLVDAATDDIFRHRLGLAALCLPELPERERRRLTPFMNRVTAEIWENWREHQSLGTQAVALHHARALSAVAESGGLVDSLPLLERLADDLRAQDRRRQLVAFNAVAEIGIVAATPSVLAGLLAGMRDPEWTVRRDATTVLGWLGAVAATPFVLTELVARLDDLHEDVRISAAETLQALGAGAATETVLARLMAGLMDSSEGVQVAIALALGTLSAMTATATDTVLSEILPRVRDSNASVRCSALWVLGALGARAATPMVLSELVARVWDLDSSVEHTATETLEMMGSAAATSAVLAELLAGLRSQETRVRYAAAGALAALGAAAATPAVLGELAVRLHDRGWWGPWEPAYVAIRAMGSVAATPAVLDGLVERVGDSNASMRISAAETLRALGAGAVKEMVVEKLTAGLSDPVERVRWEITRTMAVLGAAAPTDRVLRELVAGLKDRNASVRATALHTLRALGAAAATPTVLSELIVGLRGRNVLVRSESIDTLQALGPAAATPAVLAQLVAGLRSRNPSVRREVVGALSALGSAAATDLVLNELVAKLRDPDGHVRSAVAEALGALGPTAATPMVLAELVVRLSDPDVKVRIAVARAVSRFLRGGLRLFVDRPLGATVAPVWRVAQTTDLGRDMDADGEAYPRDRG